MAIRVLYIGIEPSLIDPAMLPPGMTTEILAQGIQDVLHKLESSGFVADWCSIDLGETAEATVAMALESQPVDCVVIGAGIRTGTPYFLLFEKVLNVVHLRAPKSKICFNTKPDDTVEAVQRWS